MSASSSSPRGVLFDIDGTLVDTNYPHVVAWFRAFRAAGHRVSMADIHRLVGQGSDRLIESLLGRDDAAVRRAHSNFYAPWRERISVFPASAELLRATAALGLDVVLATSASGDELDRHREALGADDVLAGATSKSDVEASKPAPDIVEVALERAGLRPQDAVFVGDTVWDAEAAARCGVECIGVLSGGRSEEELRGAGMTEVYRDVGQLLSELDGSAIGRLARG